MTNGDLLQLYKTIELFSGLNDEQILALVGITRQVTYQRGQTIIDQGAEGNELFIIHKGQVAVGLRRSDMEKTQTQVYLGRGQIIGEIALIDRGRRSASVRAVTNDTVMGVVDRADFEALCETNTAIGYIVMRNLASDLAYKMRHLNLEIS